MLVGKAEAPVTLDLYEDFNCPICYSHRSSGAFAAADTYAGADKALQLHGALYANQPDESSKAGLADERIVELAHSVGINSPQFDTAVNTGQFAGWVNDVADLGSKAGVNGTPTIYVNEQKVDTAQLANSSGQFDPAVLTRRINAA